MLPDSVIIVMIKSLGSSLLVHSTHKILYYLYNNLFTTITDGSLYFFSIGMYNQVRETT